MKRVCPTCKTTKFRQTSDSGLVCKYGHKILGVQVEQQEDDFAASHGRQRKRVRTLQDDDYDASPAQQRSYFLRIIQLSLQVFSRSMIQDLNFPPELEPVLRELWILYLADSKSHITEAYLFEAKTKEEELSSQQISHKTETFEEDLDLALDNKAGFSDSDSDSSSEEDIKIKGSTRCKWPSLIFSDTLVLVYLACIYLNYPILINDLLRWSNTHQLPYLSMQGRIPSDVLGKLNLGLSESMTMVPSFTPLLERSYKLSRCFVANCNLKFPPINIPLYFERFCSQFFLPVEGYYYANYILQVYRQKYYLDVSDAFLFQLQPVSVLMACVVTAAKFIYGVEEFDMSHVSQYDTSMTKQAWTDCVHKNITRWQKIKQDHHELDNIIKYLQDTSYATKASVHNRDRLNVVLNVLTKGPTSSHSRFTRHHDTNQYDMWMDTSDIITEDTTRDHANDDERSLPLIHEGEFYYTHHGGFKPQIYLDLIKLAMLVTGEPTSKGLDKSIQRIDISLEKELPTKTIKEDEYNARYNITMKDQP